MYKLKDTNSVQIESFGTYYIETPGFRYIYHPILGLPRYRMKFVIIGTSVKRRANFIEPFKCEGGFA